MKAKQLCALLMTVIAAGTLYARKEDPRNITQDDPRCGCWGAPKPAPVVPPTPPVTPPAMPEPTPIDPNAPSVTLDPQDKSELRGHSVVINTTEKVLSLATNPKTEPVSINPGEEINLIFAKTVYIYDQANNCVLSENNKDFMRGMYNLVDKDGKILLVQTSPEVTK